MKALQRLCLAILLMVLASVSALPLQAVTITCARKSSLTGAASITQATTCFTVTPAAGSTALRLDLAVASGAYDLYVKSGSVTSLTEADKVNISAVSGGLNYVRGSPGASPYTVAVVRTSRSGAARLSLATTYRAALSCSGATCTARYPLTSMPGSKYGDQAIFPVPISKAGRVQVQVAWRGTALLTALLYGPSLSKTGVTQSTLARKDGASPLTLTYDVGNTNLIQGGKWSVGLSNTSKVAGTVTSGDLSITYPK